MEFKEDEYTLSTGKVFYANNGLIGIAKQENEIDISGGYDQMIDYGDRESEFTQLERREIADFVIKLWNEWAN